MQWDATPNAGFCKESVKPWMRVNDDYPRVNVVAQTDNPRSVFSYWKNCLAFRKEHKDVFVYGGFEILNPDDKDIVAFRRFSKDESYITITNFTGKYLDWSGLGKYEIEEWVIGNHPLEQHNKNKGPTLHLRPWEGIIGKCAVAHP